MYGDGSNGALNVTSGTTNLNLDTKYQYTTVNVSSGATLSTASTTGSVLYILATTSINISGTIDVSNKVNAGQNTWSVLLDGVTYGSPSTANGGSGGNGSSSNGGAQGNGFGGGGAGGSYSAAGGNGGAGSSTPGVGGAARTTSGASSLAGNNGGGSAGGGGAAYTTAGSVSSAKGGDAYGNAAGNGSQNDGISKTAVMAGGGGAGGSAGKPGVHVILKAPTITINGTIITSGTAGSAGGDGSSWGAVGTTPPSTANGSGGGGGGGGNAGSIFLQGTSVNTTGSTLTMSGGSGGGGGYGYYLSGGAGNSGAAGLLNPTSRYAVASGNWSSPSTWSYTSGGPAGAATPTSNESVYIDANHTVTLDTSASCYAIYHTNGTFNTNGYTFTARSFQSTGTTARTLSLGSSIVSVNGDIMDANGGFNLSGSNLTFNAGTSQLVLGGGYGSLFGTGSKTFNDVRINLGVSTSSQSFTISGSPTIRLLDIRSSNSASHTVTSDNGTLTIGKFVAIGASSSNRIDFNQPESGFFYLVISDSCYAQNISMSRGRGTGSTAPLYIGSNSINNYSGATEWLLQDPQKIDTLVEPFTVTPSSNTNWNTATYSGASLPSLTSTGRLGGGYRFGNKNGIISSKTFDIVDSDVIVELPPITTTANNGFAFMLGWMSPTGAITGGGGGAGTVFIGFGFDIYYYNTSVGIDFYNTRGSGTTSSVSSLTIPSATTKYIKLRMSSSDRKVRVYPSSDGVSWDSAVVLDVSFPSDLLPLLRSSRVVLTSTPTGSGSDTIDIGSINVPPTPSATLTGSSVMDADGYKTRYGSGSMSGETIYTAIGFRNAYGEAMLYGDTNFSAFKKVRFIGSSSVTASGYIPSNAVVKTYQYKIYDQEWNYLGIWDDVVSDFGYSHEINSAGAAISVTLARNSDTSVATYDVVADDSGTPLTTDDGVTIAAETKTLNAIGPGTTVDLNLNVKIYEFSSDAVDIAGDLVFTGYISMYTSQYGTTENTVVSIFSYGADLDNYVLMDGNNTRVPYLSQDPSAILTNALDRFNSDGGIISYFHDSNPLTDDTIIDTGTIVTYTFNANTMLEVIKKCLELSPTDWFFYADLATNLLHFKPRPVTPDHYFYLGKHVLSLSLEKTMEGITNDVFFTGGKPTYSVLDRFNDVSSTNLSAHTPETGLAWVKHPSSNASHSVVISNANRIRGNAAAEGIYYNSQSIPSSDYIVEADFNIKSLVGDPGILARVDTSSMNHYLAKLDSSAQKIQLYKCISGSYSLLQELALPTGKTLAVGQTRHMQFKLEGAQLTVSLDNETYLDLEDRSIITGSYAGVRLVNADTDTTGIHIDNFQAGVLSTDNTTQIYKRYIDSSSISSYRRGVERVSDNRVTLEDSADIIAASMIARARNPRYRSSIIISGSTYDIRSIKLGDLVGFKNFGNYVDTVTMQVVRIDYSPDAVQLQLDTLLPSVPKRLEDIKRNLNQEQVSDNPDAPTV